MLTFWCAYKMLGFVDWLRVMWWSRGGSLFHCEYAGSLHWDVIIDVCAIWECLHGWMVDIDGNIL
jgi:hypothetical protein